MSRAELLASNSNNDDDDEDATTTTTDAAEAEAAAAPLYITIGPPCAGKTTWIKNNIQSDILDISLDDQPGVYHALPTRYFLEQPQTATNATSPAGTAAAADSDDEAVLQTKLYGKTVRERIRSPDQLELRSVLGRLAGTLTAEQFATASAIAPNNNTPDCVARQTLIKVVEEIVATTASSSSASASSSGDVIVPTTVDLFVREAIFRASAAESGSVAAIERTEGLLYTANVNQSLTWGNTNTKPSDYKTALTAAASAGRPVHFVVYRDDDMTVREPRQQRQILRQRAALTAAQEEEDKFDPEDQDEPTSTTSTSGNTFEDGLFDLHAEDFADLVRRSVNRLLKSGRYVPAGVIWDMRTRTANSIQRVVEAWQNSNDSHSNNSSIAKTNSSDASYGPLPMKRMSKFEFHQWLARMANFDMKDDRTVTAGYQHEPMTNNSNKRPRCGPPQRYMTDSRNGEGRRRPWDRTESAARGYSDRGRRLHHNHSLSNNATRQQLPQQRQQWNGGPGNGYPQAGGDNGRFQQPQQQRPWGNRGRQQQQQQQQQPPNYQQAAPHNRQSPQQRNDSRQNNSLQQQWSQQPGQRNPQQQNRQYPASQSPSNYSGDRPWGPTREG